jgi:[acyl-carrier-protein] S-malonyltransferase
MLGILCSGQGMQDAGGLAALCAADAGAADLVRRISARLERDLTDEAPDLFANAWAQPWIFAYQAAAWAALAPRLPRPRAVAGYSLGEMAAYVCAGALDPAEGAVLTRRRAELMDQASPAAGGLVAARGLGETRIAALCAAHGLHVAIINGPDRLVVGGDAAALPGFIAAVAVSGGQTTPLNVRVASHTPLMRPGVAPFAEVLAASVLIAPTVPVVAGVDAAPVYARDRVIATLSRQLAEPVRWADCLETLVEIGCTAFLELGPGSALARMAAERFPDMPARSLADFRHPAAAAAWVERVIA